MGLAEIADQIRRDVPEVDLPGLQWAFAQPGLVQRHGVWVEFGVHGGSTFRVLAENRGKAEVWGFDSCRGLPEAWNADHPKGHFAMVNPPMPPDGCNLVVGWFKDVLHAFRPFSQVMFAHMDCDLYSSTSDAMFWLSRRLSDCITDTWRDDVPRLGDGAVVVFDDFLSGHRPGDSYDNGVMRAVLESPFWTFFGQRVFSYGGAGSGDLDGPPRRRLELLARPRGSDVIVAKVHAR